MNDEKKKSNEFFLSAFHALWENSSDMFFIKDLDLKYVKASYPFAELVGFNNPDDLIGKTDYDIFDSELADRYTRDDKEVLKTRIPTINYIEPLPNQNGQKRYSSTSKFIITNDTNELIGICGVGRDVTVQIDLAEEKERLEQSNKLFDAVFEADITNNKMLRIGGTHYIQQLDSPLRHSFSSAVESAASNMIHPDYATEFKNQYSFQNLTSVFESGIKEFSHMTYLRFPDTQYRWFEVTTRLYFSQISGTLRLTAFLKDADEEIKNRETLKIKASTDSLTGLLNRKSIMEKINTCITGYGAEQTHALLFIDLDYFKQVNDNFGHPFGDKILKETAQRLSTLFRQNDLVGRVGGDEFLVLLKNIPSLETVEAKAEKILKTLMFEQEDNNKDIHITCSIGISLYEGDGKSLEQLYEEADQAMYKAKNSNKNRIAFY